MNDSLPDLRQMGMTLASAFFKNARWHEINNFEPSEGTTCRRRTEPEFQALSDFFFLGSPVEAHYEYCDVARCLHRGGGDVLILSKPDDYQIDIAHGSIGLSGKSGFGWEKWLPFYLGRGLVTGRGYQLDHIGRLSGHEHIEFLSDRANGSINSLLLFLMRPGMLLDTAFSIRQASTDGALPGKAVRLLGIAALTAATGRQTGFKAVVERYLKDEIERREGVAPFQTLITDEEVKTIHSWIEGRVCE